jgi:pyruvate formate lyase activating enzyme
MRGTVFDIQHYCVNDGPGIRTMIFFKGCPLRCLWCQNPESISPAPQVAFHRERCIACEECRKVCPRSAIDLPREHRIDWSRCDNCGLCAGVCTAEALEMIGKKMTVLEVVSEVKKDNAFYQRSGGGVTISGGEPTLQYEFLIELLKELKRDDYHVVLETCGFLKWERLELLAQMVDMFYLDVKGVDPALHKEQTGVENRIILSNARRLVEGGSRVVFRIPLIPGMNEGSEQIASLDRFLSEARATEIHLLPYHRFGEDKLSRIDTCQQPLGISSMKPGDVAGIGEFLGRSERKIIIDGV